MTDAGFFRGTSSDQDNRFANKQKKLLKELNYSPILGTKLNMSKIDVDSLKPWIEEKIKSILEKDDEILSDLIHEHLAEKEPDGRTILMSITGFADQIKASKFMEVLWTKLIDIQNDINGANQSTELPQSESKIKKKDSTDGGSKSDNQTNNVRDDSRHPDKASRSSRSSRTPTPPKRSISKSPTGHKLDEHSRGRPRRRVLDDSPTDGPLSQGSKSRRSRSESRSRSRGNSRDNASSKGRDDSRSRSASKSRSRTSAPGSRSRSRSYSRSSSSSRSRSSSRSSRRRSPRSPYRGSYRGRRSRSRSRSRDYRPRSRSPRGRRGYQPRGSYRGFGHPDRRRGGFSSFRRRTSPWGRRRFSPRSPPRRRRTPSYSPRRRRSPPPLGRRFSRSRSPPSHMIGRSIPSPRPHYSTGGHLDSMSSARHVHSHDMHRQLPAIARSPVRSMLDHRNYEGSLLPKRDGPIASKADLPPISQGFMPNQPGPSISSPTSGRKKHKKDKKHRKHKKSKKHRSDSSERKKKHKKHKKHKDSKKHKS